MRTRPPLTLVALLTGGALALGCSGVSAGQSGALRRTIEATPVVLDATLVRLAGAIRENEIGRVLDDPTRTSLSDADFAVLLDVADAVFRGQPIRADLQHPYFPKS